MKMLGQERENRTEKISEAIITEDFTKLMSDTKPQIQEVQRITSKINKNKFKNLTPINSNCRKSQENILKVRGY